MKGCHPMPVLMHPGEIIDINSAVKRSGRSDKTLRLWCRQYGIARQSARAGRWEFSAPALEMVVHGDIDALELLRAGDRDHPRVKRHFDHLGLPVLPEKDI